MNFVVTVFSDLFVYILSIGLQVQNKSICQSSFYVEREIRDKQSKSKPDTLLQNSLAEIGLILEQCIGNAFDRAAILSNVYSVL